MIAQQHSFATQSNPFKETIDDLLVIWWLWSAADRPHLGSPRCSPMFRDARPAAGNVHDESSEADRRIRALKARAVEAAIDQLPTWQLRVATELHAANMAGPKVWRSGRLTPEQLAQYWQEAKEILEPRLQDDGLLE